MKAWFVQEHAPGRHVSVQLTPETHEERLLLDCWIGYEANSLHVHVERLENGSLKQVTVVADSHE